jgi:hypothetical protein
MKQALRLNLYPFADDQCVHESQADIARHDRKINLPLTNILTKRNA